MFEIHSDDIVRNLIRKVKHDYCLVYPCMYHNHDEIEKMKEEGKEVSYHICSKADLLLTLFSCGVALKRLDNE